MDVLTDWGHPGANTSRGIVSPRPPILMRVVGGLGRRIRLFGGRLRFPRARFGAACDIRSGLRLRLGPGASIDFGPRCVLDNDLTVESTGRIEVGARTIFGHHCTLAACESIEIGEDCLIAEMVSIRDHDHCFDRLDIPIRDQGAAVAPIKVGRNVWLGTKVTVTKGVCIGDNAVIGANAVVTRDIPANAVAVGIPARVVRIRGAS